MGGGDPSPGPTDAWITLAGLARDTIPEFGSAPSCHGRSVPAARPACCHRRPGRRDERRSYRARTRCRVVRRRAPSLWDSVPTLDRRALRPPRGTTRDRYRDVGAPRRTISSLFPASTTSGREQPWAAQARTVATTAHHRRRERARGRTPDLAARFADECNVAFASPDETAGTVYSGLDAACRAIGRDPSTVRRSAALVVCCSEEEEALSGVQPRSGGRSTSYAENGAGRNRRPRSQRARDLRRDRRKLASIFRSSISPTSTTCASSLRKSRRHSQRRRARPGQRTDSPISASASPISSARAASTARGSASSWAHATRSVMSSAASSSSRAAGSSRRCCEAVASGSSSCTSTSRTWSARPSDDR